MSNFRESRKILIERERKEPEVLDCPECSYALRDWIDWRSMQAFGMCHDCKTNKTNENFKDN